MKYFRKALKLILLLILIAVVYLAIVLLANSIYDYRPETGPLELPSSLDSMDTGEREVFSIISWNIGYAGLGKDADFFYDGGRMVKPGREEFQGYLDGIVRRMQDFDSVDFILLQEVDTSAARSRYTNQFRLISKELSSRQGFFVTNYDVVYVPMPWLNPMAGVSSGLACFSSLAAGEASQVVFPFNYSWPMGLFMPDRLFVSLGFSIPGEKKLRIINTHNSAFDDGSLRKRQLELLYDHMSEAYGRGELVIAGGDWNMHPAGYLGRDFKSNDQAYTHTGVEKVSGPDESWHIAFDPDFPTNREVSTAYTPGVTPTAILDFFVCSPNVEVLEVKTLHDGFQYSDHQPVYMRFRLNNGSEAY